ncbi:hypothetical protein ADUPG1_004848, partial [Aduncisulcus paluster]
LPTLLSLFIASHPPIVSSLLFARSLAGHMQELKRPGWSCISECFLQRVNAGQLIVGVKDEGKLGEEAAEYKSKVLAMNAELRKIMRELELNGKELQRQTG